MTNLYNAVSHASSRRPIALRNEDYDHEISLIDHTDLSRIGSRSVDISRSDGDSITPQSTNTTGTRRHSYDHGKHGSKIRNNIEHKRWSKKWTEERLGERAGQLIPTDVESDHGVTPTTSSNLRIVVTEDGDDENGRHSPPKQGTVITSMTIDRTPTSPTLESAIDVLYENQRGGFLCGLPLFGSRALGWFDAAPWTNIAFKPSATSIKNAQVPDPSWEWTGPDWVVNHDPDNEALDDEGWEYSFMFSNSFSWHGPNWYSSFVRRRAWIRKRVRTQPDRLADDPVRLTAEYFTVHAERPLSASISASPRSSRLETTRPELETTDKARGIEQMLLALKECRIDREKIEVVEAFVKRADEDLGELASRMHEVMRMFIFQASRRTLHVHLTAAFDEESARNKEVEENDEVANTEVDRRKLRLAHLLKAIEAADEEVKRLEYWSDIKGVTEDGVVKHAVDQEHGWDPAWRGLDTSSPRDVITEAQMLGVDEGPAKRAEELPDRRPSTSDSKGKGKKKEEL